MKTKYFLLLLPALFASCAVENMITSTPLAKTDAPLSVQDTYAQMGGAVYNDAGSLVSEYGLVLSTTNAEPTINDTKFIEGLGEGEFSKLYYNLEGNTTYYYRVYGINDSGAGYGEVMSFTTLPSACNPTVENQVTAGNATINVTNVVKETNWATYENGNIRFYTHQDGNNNVVTLQFNETYQALPATGTYKTAQTFTNLEPSSDWKVKVYFSTNGQPNEGTLAPDGEYVFVENNNGTITFTFCGLYVNSQYTLEGKFTYN